MKKKTTNINVDSALLGMIFGGILGIPASYFMQSSLLRAFMSLGDYIQNFSEVIQDEQLGPTVLIGIVIFAGIGLTLGIVTQRYLNTRKQ